MASVEKGDRVVARSLHGEPLNRRAVSGEVAGRDFQVVWICRDEEWEAAEREGRDPRAVPWPAEDVSLSTASPA
jgi:hypothetical protein